MKLDTLALSWIALSACSAPTGTGFTSDASPPDAAAAHDSGHLSPDASGHVDSSTPAGDRDSSTPTADAGSEPRGGLGPADLSDAQLDAVSRGGTLTMQQIGAAGWYPSRRDPQSGTCDAIDTEQCCMTKHELRDDKLSPWNEELILTLRGPMLVEQLAVYQPAVSGAWSLVSAWDARRANEGWGFQFDNNGTQSFAGKIGSECLVDVALDMAYPCGPNSVPYCSSGTAKHYGFSGSKLFVMLASMPHVGDAGYESVEHCSSGPGGNWYDAPWIGLSHGELVRSGKFGGCHCYAKDPAKWALADGCGQFNVFEVVNDNNAYANLDLFSTNLFAYHGYVGEGPCGQDCKIAGLPSTVDLVDKATSQPAARGGLITPSKGPGVALRRPAAGYRYFIILLDVDTRTIQLGLVHPLSIPSSASRLLPNLPSSLDRASIDALLKLRLPE